jgi:hypothetical protein
VSRPRRAFRIPVPSPLPLPLPPASALPRVVCAVHLASRRLAWTELCFKYRYLLLLLPRMG